MQNFRALGAPPPDPRASGGFAPKPPASGGWGLRPQTPIGLRRLGAPPPDPQTAPIIANFWLLAWLFDVDFGYVLRTTAADLILSRTQDELHYFFL